MLEVVSPLRLDYLAELTLIGVVAVIFSWLIGTRKQAEQAVRESEERYRALVNLGAEVGEAVIMLQDTEQGEGIQTFVNKEGPRITGYPEEELLGMSFFDLIHPKDRAAFMDMNRRKMQGEVMPNLFEMSIIRKDGTEVPIEITSAYTIYKGERADVCYIRDITERKRAEEALRESQEKLWWMFESVTDGLLVIDLNGVIIELNEKAVEMHGFSSKDELLDKSAIELVAPHDHKRIATNMRKVIKRGAIRDIEYTLLKADGAEFPAELSTSVLKDASGNPVGHITLVRDITERKRVEAERKELEQKAQLASRLATVGEMASGIAHEINNPLTSIIGFAQLVMDRNIPDDIREDIGVIYSEAQRTAEVVKNLLTFARKHAPASQLTNINSVVEDILKLRAYEHRVNNIQVNTRFDPKLPETVVDYFQMQQVFLNIILNGETAMLEAHNKGTLTITTQKVNSTINVSFTDDGPGIAKENLSRIFDPFFTTREVGKGTGLGLSVCYGIVAEHGGRIYARSKLGKGATFVVELPINAD